MSRKPFIAFYAERAKYVAILYMNVQNILEFAKAIEVNYIVIDNSFLGIRYNYMESESLMDYSDKASLVSEKICSIQLGFIKYHNEK